MNYNSNELFNIKGNVIFITGAGRGIGQTVALGFASSGAKVACFDLNKECLKYKVNYESFLKDFHVFLIISSSEWSMKMIEIDCFLLSYKDQIFVVG